MFTGEENEAVQLEAAHALSKILSQNGILHAFVGGFAIRLLGAYRPTEDIDAIIGVDDPRDIIDRIRPLLQEQDSRFSVEGLKLYFTSKVHQSVRIPVETLPIGAIGLPTSINTFSPESEKLPILPPSNLILTKINRWAMLAQSTRPRSIMKAQTDLRDITYLLQWLAQRKEKIDFTGYKATYPEKLFDAVRQLVHIGKKDSDTALLELIFLVIKEEDLPKIEDT